MKQFSLSFLLSVGIIFTFTTCKKGGGLNIFSISDELKLGEQTHQEILSNPAEFPILPAASNAAAYNYINGIVNDILAAGEVTYKDEFAWKVYIIDRDDVVNAFCTPGGYIYVYTGLIKYLDDKSSLAGVMGHEMAHADRRHSTKQLTKIYGIQTLLDVALGNDQNMLTQIASELVFLQFSRDAETEADNYSVTYLCPSKYHADGAANFFQKIIDEGQSSPPQFLSTHPNPDNRVENIEQKAADLNCTTTIGNSENVTSYTQFKALF